MAIEIDTGSVFEPLHDNIIIRPVDPSINSTSGLVLPATADKPLIFGEVLAVGPGRMLPNGELNVPAVEVGQMVCLRSGGASVEMGIAGHNHLCARWVDLLCVLKPAEMVEDRSNDEAPAEE